MKLINADYLTGRIFTEADLTNAHTCYDSIMAIIESMESEDVLDKIKAEFTNRYPKNYAGELEFGGNICHFSLNDVMQIIDYVLRIDDNYRNEVNE